MSNLSYTKLIKTIFIKASPEHVWEYLVDKDKLGEWFHRGKSTLKNGEKYALLGKGGKDLCWGDVLEVRKPNKLVYTFTHGHLEGSPTTVIWELTAIHGGTKVMLTHYGFEDAPSDPLTMLQSHDKGWDEHLTRLREKSAQS